MLDAAAKGGFVNTLFEEHLFALVGALERISKPLRDQGIPHELIGGGAVMVQVNRADPSAVRLTKDIDIMIRRADLNQVAKISETGNVRRLLFTGEKVRPNQTIPNPPLRPEYLTIHAVEIAVIPVADLVVMKLSSNRDIDRVHIRDLDSVGLITAESESQLPPELRERLRQIRSTE